MRHPIILVLVITAIFVGGCASDYSPRADLSSVHTIGLVVPADATEPQSAKEFVQFYNRTVTEDRLNNSAVGAGSGAAVGTAAGIGAGAIIGCTAGGFLAPLCWTVVIASGAVIGGGTGAIAGATVDTQEQVKAAPVHIYEVNKVLPDLQNNYLTNADLENRALRLVRRQFPSINFVTAEPDGERYRFVTEENTGTSYSDVNLVLSDFHVQLAGKAKNDPNLRLSIHTRWVLRKYDSSAHQTADWDIVEGNYQTEKYELSEWLADDGALLRSHLDSGIKSSFNGAFVALGPETEEEQWARISPEDSF
jgi:hypothetical protein